MDNLRRFNGDRNTKEDLLEYIITSLEDSIVARAYKKENTDSLADASIEIKKAFNQLDIDFEVKVKDDEPTNEAR